MLDAARLYRALMHGTPGVPLQDSQQQGAMRSSLLLLTEDNGNERRALAHEEAAARDKLVSSLGSMYAHLDALDIVLQLHATKGRRLYYLVLQSIPRMLSTACRGCCLEEPLSTRFPGISGFVRRQHCPDVRSLGILWRRACTKLRVQVPDWYAPLWWPNRGVCPVYNAYRDRCTIADEAHEHRCLLCGGPHGVGYRHPVSNEWVCPEMVILWRELRTLGWGKRSLSSLAARWAEKERADAVRSEQLRLERRALGRVVDLYVDLPGVGIHDPDQLAMRGILRWPAAEREDYSHAFGKLEYFVSAMFSGVAGGTPAAAWVRRRVDEVNECFRELRLLGHVGLDISVGIVAEMSLDCRAPMTLFDTTSAVLQRMYRKGSISYTVIAAELPLDDYLLLKRSLLDVATPAGTLAQLLYGDILVPVQEEPVLEPGHCQRSAANGSTIQTAAPTRLLLEDEAGQRRRLTDGGHGVARELHAMLRRSRAHFSGLNELAGGIAAWRQGFLFQLEEWIGRQKLIYHQVAARADLALAVSIMMESVTQLDIELQLFSTKRRRFYNLVLMSLPRVMSTPSGVGELVGPGQPADSIARRAAERELLSDIVDLYVHLPGIAISSPFLLSRYGILRWTLEPLCPLQCFLLCKFSVVSADTALVAWVKTRVYEINACLSALRYFQPRGLDAAVGCCATQARWKVSTDDVADVMLRKHQPNALQQHQSFARLLPQLEYGAYWRRLMLFVPDFLVTGFDFLPAPVEQMAPSAPVQRGGQRPAKERARITPEETANAGTTAAIASAVVSSVTRTQGSREGILATSRAAARMARRKKARRETWATATRCEGDAMHSEEGDHLIDTVPVARAAARQDGLVEGLGEADAPPAVVAKGAAAHRQEAACASAVPAAACCAVIAASHRLLPENAASAKGRGKRGSARAAEAARQREARRVAGAATEEPGSSKTRTKDCGSVCGQRDVQLERKLVATLPTKVGPASTQSHTEEAPDSGGANNVDAESELEVSATGQARTSQSPPYKTAPDNALRCSSPERAAPPEDAAPRGRHPAGAVPGVSQQQLLDCPELGREGEEELEDLLFDLVDAEEQQRCDVEAAMCELTHACIQGYQREAQNIQRGCRVNAAHEAPVEQGAAAGPFPPPAHRQRHRPDGALPAPLPVHSSAPPPRMCAITLSPGGRALSVPAEALDFRNKAAAARVPAGRVPLWCSRERVGGCETPICKWVHLREPHKSKALEFFREELEDERQRCGRCVRLDADRPLGSNALQRLEAHFGAVVRHKWLGEPGKERFSLAVEMATEAGAAKLLHRNLPGCITRPLHWALQRDPAEGQEAAAAQDVHQDCAEGGAAAHSGDECSGCERTVGAAESPPRTAAAPGSPAPRNPVTAPACTAEAVRRHLPIWYQLLMEFPDRQKLQAWKDDLRMKRLVLPPGTDVLARYYMGRPSVCFAHNRAVGGCLNSECKREHSCVFCGGDHGVLSRDGDEDFVCPKWAKLDCERRTCDSRFGWAEDEVRACVERAKGGGRVSQCQVIPPAEPGCWSGGRVQQAGRGPALQPADQRADAPRASATAVAPAAPAGQAAVATAAPAACRIRERRSAAALAAAAAALLAASAGARRSRGLRTRAAARRAAAAAALACAAAGVLRAGPHRIVQGARRQPAPGTAPRQTGGSFKAVLLSGAARAPQPPRQQKETPVQGVSKLHRAAPEVRAAGQPKSTSECKVANSPQSAPQPRSAQRAGTTAGPRPAPPSTTTAQWPKLPQAVETPQDATPTKVKSKVDEHPRAAQEEVLTFSAVQHRQDPATFPRSAAQSNAATIPEAALHQQPPQPGRSHHRAAAAERPTRPDEEQSGCRSGLSVPRASTVCSMPTAHMAPVAAVLHRSPVVDKLEATLTLEEGGGPLTVCRAPARRVVASKVRWLGLWMWESAAHRLCGSFELRGCPSSDAGVMIVWNDCIGKLSAVHQGATEALLCARLVHAQSTEGADLLSAGVRLEEARGQDGQWCNVDRR
eukprot:TRINITY_DN269_c1_g2_i1.p1 TRINITY_DN269_c1_g2~~TRINITY_DN269_c1_g2_i1.p1  ORF type:complete len:2042 (+),score=186.40 TRINITY_DN269_c1_g2_i1:116-6127(+)